MSRSDAIVMQRLSPRRSASATPAVVLTGIAIVFAVSVACMALNGLQAAASTHVGPTGLERCEAIAASTGGDTSTC
jgi:hypothetical protein